LKKNRLDLENEGSLMRGKFDGTKNQPVRYKKYRLFCPAMFQKGRILTGPIYITIDLSWWEKILTSYYLGNLQAGMGWERVLRRVGLRT
jgi:hypothetical protein